jgi:tetratricopeptide (TPR) repeat protein
VLLSSALVIFRLVYLLMDRAATATQQQALELFGDLGDRYGQAHVLNELGAVQRLTGDYAAAAASHQQAFELFREFGARLGQAVTLNSLAEPLSRSSAGQQAREHHARALAIARDLGAPWRRHARWKASAAATSRTATPAKAPRACGRHSLSTSASEPPMPSASRKPSSSIAPRRAT